VGERDAADHDPGTATDERFEFWRDTIGRVAVQFRMEPVSKVAEGQIRLAEIGDLGLMNFDSAVVTRYARTRAEIARSQGPYYFVHLQLHGYCLLERGEERSTLAVGDCFVGDTLREFAMAFVTPDGLGKRSLVVRFPKEVLAGRVARPDLVHGAVLRSNRPVTRLLTGYLLNGLQIADGITPEAATLFESHAVELLAQSLRESWSEQPQPSESWREALFVRACRLIKLRHADPHLSPETFRLRRNSAAR
jgi:hypothetical protein